MENNLYYTPTIEEFHVGFECELIDNDKTFKWFPIECTQETLYDVQSSHYNARVKYLDQSDIESLGWGNFTFKNINGYNRASKFLTINFNYKEPVVDISYLPMLKNDELSRIFRGTIKNKSELIKLMQQLNIK